VTNCDSSVCCDNWGTSPLRTISAKKQISRNVCNMAILTYCEPSEENIMTLTNSLIMCSFGLTNPTVAVWMAADYLPSPELPPAAVSSSLWRSTDTGGDPGLPTPPPPELTEPALLWWEEWCGWYVSILGGRDEVEDDGCCWCSRDLWTLNCNTTQHNTELQEGNEVKGKAVAQHTYRGAGARGCIAPTHSRPRH
jgi:hypothetical protein